MASTVEKTNIDNVKDNQDDRKKMIVIGQLKKQNFYWNYFIFPTSLFRFTLFTLCEMYSDIASFHFFVRNGIATIYVPDSIRAACTRSLSATKFIPERHLFEKCEHGLNFSNLLRNTSNWYEEILVFSYLLFQLWNRRVDRFLIFFALGFLKLPLLGRCLLNC